MDTNLLKSNKQNNEVGFVDKNEMANEFFVGHKGPTTVAYQDSYHHCRQI